MRLPGVQSKWNAKGHSLALNRGDFLGMGVGGLRPWGLLRVGLVMNPITITATWADLDPMGGEGHRWDEEEGQQALRKVDSGWVGGGAAYGNTDLQTIQFPPWQFLVTFLRMRALLPSLPHFGRQVPLLRVLLLTFVLEPNEMPHRVSPKGIQNMEQT